MHEWIRAAGSCNVLDDTCGPQPFWREFMKRVSARFVAHDIISYIFILKEILAW
jgi:hypothetical protein